MSKVWTGISAGLLAGAAGATAKNAVSYLDQIVSDDAPPSSPNSATVAKSASAAATVATEQAPSGNRATALGALGGLGIGAVVGAIAGALRGSNATPNPVVAALLTGGAAMVAGDGIAAITGAPKARSGTNLGRDAIAHLAYGAVTGIALHKMLDPRSTDVARFNPFG